MKEAILLLYELYKIDKKLQEINELRGDLPLKIEQLTTNKEETEEELRENKAQLSEIEAQESTLLNENDILARKIDKNDDILRSGGVRSNIEYNALAREIDDAYDKIAKNDGILEKEVKPKKTELIETLTKLQDKFNELESSIREAQQELEVVKKQTEEDEKNLIKQRNECISKIDTEHLTFYERINVVKFGDAIAFVRNESCLRCFSSIPPQRVIEIRKAEQLFRCESCGRILFPEEFISK